MTIHEEGILRALVRKWAEQGAPKGYSGGAYDEGMQDALVSVSDELHDTLQALLETPAPSRGIPGRTASTGHMD